MRYRFFCDGVSIVQSIIGSLRCSNSFGRMIFSHCVTGNAYSGISHQPRNKQVHSGLSPFFENLFHIFSNSLPNQFAVDSIIISPFFGTDGNVPARRLFASLIKANSEIWSLVQVPPLEFLTTAILE